MSKIDKVEGHHRVAALLLSLEQETRAALMAKLSDDAVASVAAAMTDLDPRLTETGIVDLLKSDLARSLHGETSVSSCDTTTLHGMLSAGIGRQRAETVVQEITARRERDRPFHAIEVRDPFEVGLVLRNESHAVAALVLAHIDPSVSANILKVFAEEDGIEVLRRMATLEPPNPEVLQTVAAHLLQQIESAPAVAGDADPSARLKTVADVLNNGSPELEKGVIEVLTDTDISMAQELREFMFTWEDIATIDTRTMQKILGTVDTKTLSIALKGSAFEIEDNILGNLSSRVRDMVAEERELAGPVPMTEVDSARDDIMKNIRAMIEAGEFRPAKGGEDLVA